MFDVNGSITQSGNTYNWSKSDTASGIIDEAWKQVSGNGTGGDGKLDIKSSSGGGKYSRENSQYRDGVGSKGARIEGTINESSESNDRQNKSKGSGLFD